MALQASRRRRRRPTQTQQQGSRTGFDLDNFFNMMRQMQMFESQNKAMSERQAAGTEAQIRATEVADRRRTAEAQVARSFSRDEREARAKTAEDVLRSQREYEEGEQLASGIYDIAADPTMPPEIQDVQAAALHARHGTPMPHPPLADFGGHRSDPVRRRLGATAAARQAPPELLVTPEATAEQLAEQFSTGPLLQESRLGPQTKEGAWSSGVVVEETPAGASIKDALQRRIEQARGQDIHNLETRRAQVSAEALGRFPTAARLAQINQYVGADVGGRTRADQQRPGLTIRVGVDAADRALAEDYTVIIADTGEVLTIPKGFRGQWRTLDRVFAGKSPDDPLAGTPYILSYPIPQGSVGVERGTEVAHAAKAGLEPLVATPFAVDPATGQGLRVAPAGTDPSKELDLTFGRDIPGLGSLEDLLDDLEMQAIRDLYPDLSRAPVYTQRGR